jgi:hypothetical protein
MLDTLHSLYLPLLSFRSSYTGNPLLRALVYSFSTSFDHLVTGPSHRLVLPYTSACAIALPCAVTLVA